jgi:exopolyphosphatase / guanosine-5'-triphosphate,3'-diphosphate pyrophosphatase
MTSESSAAGERTEKIVPRWEWRTFGDEFEEARKRLAAFEPQQVNESDEIYLLSVDGDASIKLRDGLVDVKRLDAVNDDGLERWIPVMKAPFPLSARDAQTVVTRAGTPNVALERGMYTVEQFAREIIEPHPGLRTAAVHKHRTRYVIDTCMVENTDFEVESKTIHTIAIESPDPALVCSMIDRLGLTGRHNVNVARGLKTLLGFGAQRGAVIDVGTNSVKFYVGEVLPDRSVQTVVDRANVTRLGEGLDASGQLSDDAIARTVDAIAAMHDEAVRQGASKTVIVGTAGLRSAQNRAAFDEALRDRCGLSVEIIPGEEEGRLAYVAAVSTLPISSGRLVVFDSGGGSTQFSIGHGARVDDRFSLDIGAVRVSERYGLTNAVTEDALTKALDGIAGDLARLDAAAGPDAVIAMGGTVTNLAAVKHELAPYDADIVRGTVLDQAEIDRQIARYRARDADERRKIVGLQPNRAEVILGGACIVRTILTKLGIDSLTVTDRGLRHGVFTERFAS